jgi:outer membrane protein
MRKLIPFLLVPFLLVAIPLATAAAGADEPAAQPLSLRQAVDLALRSNTQYRIAAAALKAARAQVKQARSAFFPTVDLEYSYTYQNVVSTLVTPLGALPFAPNETSVPLAALHYTLYDGGLSAARFGRASARLAEAEAAEQAARSSVELQTSAAYFDLLAAIRQAEVADRAVRLASDHARLARQRFDVGLVPRADLLAAQTDLANQQMQAIAAHNRVTLAQSALDAVMNVPLGTLHTPTEELSATAPAIDLNEMIATSLRSRAELAAANNAVAAAESAVKAASAGRLPHLNLMLSDGNAQPVLTTGYHNQFSLGLQAVWTLFDGGYSDGAIAGAQAALAQAKLRLEALRTDIELAVRRAYADYTAAQAQVDAAEHLVELADENQRLAEIRYRGGVGTALELRDAELHDVAANQQLISAKIQLRESLVRLRYEAGLL